jgi:hypothetical protein
VAVVVLVQAGEVDNLMLLVGEEDSLDMAAGAHHLQAAPFGDDDDPLCGCRDSRDSLSGCLFQAPISVCRSRSSQSDKWDLLSLVNAVPNNCMLSSHLTRWWLPHGWGRRRRDRGLSMSIATSHVRTALVVVW